MPSVINLRCSVETPPSPSSCATKYLNVKKCAFFIKKPYVSQSERVLLFYIYMSLPVFQSRPFLSEQETDLAKERSFGQANMPSIVSKITKFSRIVTINQINHLNLKKYPPIVSNRWKNQRIFVNGREFPFIHFQSNFDYIRIF